MFVSYGFIGFLILFFLIYYLVPGRFQWIVLLAANFAFYATAGGWSVVYILLSSVTVWLAGLRIHATEDKKKRKGWMLFALLLNLGILGVTKYTGFVIDNLNAVSGGSEIPQPDLLVPFGISFYTFQAVAYLLDVYWGRCEVQKNLPRFILFVSFFPQLIQGPISRYKDLSETLYTVHRFDWTNVSYGLQRILWGYFKKMVIADRIGIALAALTESPEYYTGLYVLLAILFWAVELYADFSGGIDITIGIAQVCGIRLTENFNHPYFSRSIAEFWRRWHITMGTWFRDYLFYPLSISHPMKKLTKKVRKRWGMKGAKRTSMILCTMIVWFATGVWHGADWRYILWGLTNGIVILISAELGPLYRRFHKNHPKAAGNAGYRFFQIVRTFLLMGCINLFDVYDSVGTVFRQFIHMFTQIPQAPVTAEELLDLGLSGGDYVVILIGTALMLVVSLAGRKGDVRGLLAGCPYAARAAVFGGLFAATILFGSYGIGFDAQQFIYNQF